MTEGKTTAANWGEFAQNTPKPHRKTPKYTEGNFKSLQPHFLSITPRPRGAGARRHDSRKESSAPNKKVYMNIFF